MVKGKSVGGVEFNDNDLDLVVVVVVLFVMLVLCSLQLAREETTT